MFVFVIQVVIQLDLMWTKQLVLLYFTFFFRFMVNMSGLYFFIIKLSRGTISPVPFQDRVHSNWDHLLLDGLV